MFFARRLPTASLIALCRALRHGLGAGLTLVQVFRQQAERGPRGLQAFAKCVLTRLERGTSLCDALQPEKSLLPALFLAMAEVGEETGHLAEVCGDLEKYYTLQESLRKQFRAQSMLPVIQLCAAFLIVAGLIFVLGAIASSGGGRPAAIFGLRGAAGAIWFLISSFGTLALLWCAWLLLARVARQNAAIDALLLRVPIIGPCILAFVMGRFCMAVCLTFESAMPIARALRLSLAATGNAAFTAQTDTITQAVKQGAPMALGLTRSGLFPNDFLSLVVMAEEGGRVPEVLRQQTDYWNEEAALRLKITLRLASWAVWACYAVFMVSAIFNVARIYLGGLSGGL